MRTLNQYLQAQHISITGSIKTNGIFNYLKRTKIFHLACTTLNNIILSLSQFSLPAIVFTVVPFFIVQRKEEQLSYGIKS